MEKISIAIDGPAGAGKSTIAKTIAKELDIVYVDTGAMYRAFGLYCLRNKISPDSSKLNEMVDCVNIKIKYNNGEQQVILNDENVTSLIRDEAVGSITSAISSNKKVRLKLVELQRELANEISVIMDGRDIGTYVLPDATIKIYLTASVEKRADRRWNELKQKGILDSYDKIKDEIEKRDYRDMNRDFAPLKKAEDAIEVDTSELTIDEVIDVVLKIIKKGRR